MQTLLGKWSTSYQKFWHAENITQTNNFKNITGATSRSNPMVRETSKEPTTSSIGGTKSFFDHSVSEPASPETGGENADQADKNTEA